MPVTKSQIFSISSDAEFERTAMQQFHYQAKKNTVYRKYLEQLSIDAATITAVQQIPFLPVEFFKYFEVVTGKEKAKITFTSSGTSGAEQSRHPVSDLSLYEESFTK